MDATFCLALKADTDGTGELSARVEVLGFTGHGAAWFRLAEIAEFGHTLENAYPLHPDRSYALEGGHWNSEVRGQLEHALFSMRFYPVGTLGNIGCRVRLAHSESGHAPEYAVTVELRTHHEALRAFGSSVTALAEARCNEAFLACSGV